MTVVYLIPPGTRIAVSDNGADFRVQTSPQLQFRQPPELDESHAVFTRGKKWIRVARADVIVSYQNGQVGSNQFGV